jgi:hypothetical protein
MGSCVSCLDGYERFMRGISEEWEHSFCGAVPCPRCGARMVLRHRVIPAERKCPECLKEMRT